MSNILKTVTTRVERPASKALIVGATFINDTSANPNRPKVDHVFNRDLPPDLMVPLASLRLAGWTNKNRRPNTKDPIHTISIEVTPEEFDRITTYEKAAREKRLAAEAATAQNAPTQNALPTHEEIPF